MSVLALLVCNGKIPHPLGLVFCLGSISVSLYRQPEILPIEGCGADIDANSYGMLLTGIISLRHSSGFPLVAFVRVPDSTESHSDVKLQGEVGMFCSIQRL